MNGARPLPDAPLELVEIFDQPSVRGAHIGPLLIQAWRGQPMQWEQEIVGEAYRAMAARHPQGFASLALLHMTEHFGSPDAQVRKTSIEQYREIGPLMSVSAMVVDADSLGAKTLRAFLSALLLIVRPETPTRVFGSFDEAFEWMTEIDGGLASLVGDARVITQIREAVRAWSGRLS